MDAAADPLLAPYRRALNAPVQAWAALVVYGASASNLFPAILRVRNIGVLIIRVRCFRVLASYSCEQRRNLACARLEVESSLHMSGGGAATIPPDAAPPDPGLTWRPQKGLGWRPLATEVRLLKKHCHQIAITNPTPHVASRHLNCAQQAWESAK